MKSYLDRITIQPAQLDGKPCIRGLRISVQTVLEFLSVGNTAEEVIEQYPLLTKEDITACLQYAAKISGKEISYQIV
ncbi:DUF433 domain-containing protein [Flavisolibacter ginsenosidimutans]|uniref:DUF433 domain-containing protein n=1 Tax=Flavisolibacter ginsenosidimutans TaxID=661481 RepID=A0A5B8UKK9_9BACT|nr:DUF433 domain-containing protein [Flavisolibacter ginsenosidimutans]QEC57227.1 DUF433 domain-containing protein [Flavisolibacter ginsenosidimutans]